jgi:hypothetical protein
MRFYFLSKDRLGFITLCANESFPDEARFLGWLYDGLGAPGYEFRHIPNSCVRKLCGHLPPGLGAIRKLDILWPGTGHP